MRRASNGVAFWGGYSFHIQQYTIGAIMGGDVGVITEDQIIYERGHHFVLEVGSGYFKVLRNTLTHSVVCATYHNVPDGCARAIEDCNRRAADGGFYGR